MIDVEIRLTNLEKYCTKNVNLLGESTKIDIEKHEMLVSS